MNKHRRIALVGAASVTLAVSMIPAGAAGTRGLEPAGSDSTGRAVATGGHGGKIAFTRTVRIGQDWQGFRQWVYVMGADGSHLRRLAEGSHPSWSRNGRRLVFAGPDGITVMDARGEHQQVLGPRSRWVWDPAWSPDGRRIAFGIEIGNNDCGIAVMDADGSNVQQVTRPGCTAEGDDLKEPAWSPDGRWLVYTFEDDLDNPYLDVVNVATERVRRLGPGWDPAWSPDGSRIMFNHIDGPIYTMGVNGRHLRRLGSGSSPAWSPNGRRIVFKIEGPGRSLYVMSANGRQVRRLTRPPAGAYDSDPAWFGAAPTRTTVNASPEPVAKGTLLTVSGKVTKVGVALPQAAVTIRFRAAGAHRYATVTKLRTGSAGRYRVTVTARRSGVWQAVHPGSAATLTSKAADEVKVRR